MIELHIQWIGDDDDDTGTSDAWLIYENFLDNELNLHIMSDEFFRIKTADDNIVYTGTLFSIVEKYNVGTIFAGEESDWDYAVIPNEHARILNTWLTTYSNSVTLESYIESVFGIRNEQDT